MGSCGSVNGVAFPAQGAVSANVDKELKHYHVIKADTESSFRNPIYYEPFLRRAENRKKWFHSKAFMSSEVNVWQNTAHGFQYFSSETEKVRMRFDWILHSCIGDEFVEPPGFGFRLKPVQYNRSFFFGVHNQYKLAIDPQEQFEMLRKQQEIALTLTHKGSPERLISRWQNKNRYLIKDIVKKIGTFILYTVDSDHASHVCDIQMIQFSPFKL
jgi:hypothetical protein